MSYLRHVYSMELRKLIAYRVDFWLNACFTIGAQLLIAFYLWTSIFEARGVQEMEGYGLEAMMAYYLCAIFSAQIVHGPMGGSFNREIYDGSLSKYLVYPVSLFAFKFARSTSNASLYFLQLLVVVFLIDIIFGFPAGSEPELVDIAMVIPTYLLAIATYFCIASCFELGAFWADHVWSLLVMLQLINGLFGGVMLPLEFFPVWLQEICAYLPFQYLIALPAKTLLGQVSFFEWWTGLCVLAAWCLLSLMTLRFIWRRGLLQYSGVGM